jgi:hypothetical protein
MMQIYFSASSTFDFLLNSKSLPLEMQALFKRVDIVRWQHIMIVLLLPAGHATAV